MRYGRAAGRFGKTLLRSSMYVPAYSIVSINCWTSIPVKNWHSKGSIFTRPSRDYRAILVERDRFRKTSFNCTGALIPEDPFHIHRTSRWMDR